MDPAFGGAHRRQLLRRRHPGTLQADQRGGHLLRRAPLQQAADQRQFLLAGRLGEHRVGQQAVGVAGMNGIGVRHVAPARPHAGGGEQFLGAAPAVDRHHQHAVALAPGTAGAPAAVQQHVAVVGQIGMDHQVQRRQVESARRHVGGHAHPRVAVAQRLQGAGTLGLAELAGQRHRGEAALQQAGVQAPHGLAGGAEHQRRRCLLLAQHVHHGVQRFVRRRPHRAIGDVGMRAVAAQRVDAQSVALELAGKGGDVVRNGGGEHQGSPALGRGAQQLLELLAKAEVEHFVGLVQHHGRERRQHQRAAAQMVAQATRRADHDM